MFTSELAPVAEIRGTFGVDRKAKRLDCSNKFPEYTCAHYFKEYLEDMGIYCAGAGDFRLDTSWEPAGEIVLLGKTFSPELDRIIFQTNHASNNLYAETLLRTGIGHLTIVDFDKVDTTNLNRQVVATHDNIGQSKVLEMQKRLLSIAPEADVQAIDRQYNSDTADTFDLAQYDIVVDAIDMVECKALLLYRATQAGCKVYSSMGAGRKTDPQKIRTAEFWKVQGCPLARALRTKMKKAGLMPASKIQCVYSEEIAGEKGTLAPVVGVFGMTLAAMVIDAITSMAD
jgi:tRNA A37 threonylcarbamoyladenosine dehydratase